MRTLVADYSIIGRPKPGVTFSLRTLKEDRDGLVKGLRVVVLGDAVPPREAEVVSVSDDQREVELTFA